ncbi:MAG: hypothetical protein CMP67_06860 [Flavobacteriales bacterium]|nr:hypothetical protein [Flavobacteriales bacterium]MBO72252.1 hypothetical protein [Flavobacteriales bacterium]|tara:strand:+ start:684 stop:992 length:309 start_codon:yes stop_codon:yes gene_type:complete
MSEEKKYNIKLNPKKPNKEEIRKKMDFKGAYKAYSHKVYRTPWYSFQRHSSKNRKVSMFIILICVVGALVFIESEKEFNQKNKIPPSIQDSTLIKADTLKLK